jgi:two-component system, NtrC family, response regulator GlrR
MKEQGGAGARSEALRRRTEGLPDAAAPHASVQRFSLAVLDGPDAGLRFTSAAARSVIGTHESADLRLRDRAVSRFHCEIHASDRGLLLRDLGSRNGTTLEGVAVVVAPLAPDLVIGVGRSRLKVAVERDRARIPLSSRASFGGMTARSERMRALFAVLERAASTDATILLLGETGTGKEVLAQAIHAESARRAGPFVVVDCGGIPGDLVESELFGHERGAFTGAQAQRQGAFAAARGGTLLLDEIGELPLDVQPKLLGALERRAARRVGSDRSFKIDVRIIAATNRDLRAEVNAQRFRPDLFFRLAVVPVELPPLRERLDDLPLLVEALLEDLGAAERPETSLLRSDAFHEELAQHGWPGNVRELRNYIESCLALRRLLPPEGEPADERARLTLPLRLARERCVRDFERRYLEEAMRRHQGNVTAAARAAGVDRAYFHRMLLRHGLR